MAGEEMSNPAKLFIIMTQVILPMKRFQNIIQIVSSTIQLGCQSDVDILTPLFDNF